MVASLSNYAPPTAPTLSDELKISIVSQPEPQAKPAKINLPEIDIQSIDEVGNDEWSNWGWPEDTTEVAFGYKYANDKLTIRYSSLFPRFKSALDQFTLKDAGLGTSFRKRYEIWLTTSVLIHWQDTQSDATPIQHAELGDEEKDNFRNDELRRMGKTAVVFSQREVSQLGKEFIEED